MQWQELVLTIGQIVFIIALLPSVFSEDKPEIWTSILTGAVAFSIAVTYVTLSIPFAAISAAGNGILWTVLVIQKYRQPTKTIKSRSRGK